jgi:hypothetical protein
MLTTVTLRIRQYVYFSVTSSIVSAEDMTKAIGLAPDKVLVRGSRRPTDPPVPNFHAWKLVCDERGRQVGEQLEMLIGRLRPYQAAIRALVDDLDTHEGNAAGARLQIVRYLDDEDGEPDGWQHRLLGWHLTGDMLRFALDTRAEIDIDEYGQD